MSGVITVELVNIVEMDSGLDDVVQRATGGFEDFLDMAQGEERFLFDSAAERLGGLRIDRSLAADIYPAIDLNGSGIGAGALFLIGMLDFSFGHTKDS